MRSSMVMVAVLSGHAYADDVNLLKSTPTTVAVSSTVANAAILPDHLVDGKLATAWNSQTGELAGAWIAVRVPADARVKTIKLVAGFAHKVKKQDFFTMNPRIKKVRVTQGGKVLAEKVLDIENRGLQEVPVDIAGGDFEIRVLEVVNGSKKNWREACVSELEVWGTTPKPVKAKPAVRIRSLDAAPTLTREQCIKAVGPARGRVVGTVEAIPWSDASSRQLGIVVCRVDHGEKRSTETTTEIAAVGRVRRAILNKVTASFTNDYRADEGMGESGSVQLDVLPLTAKEDALLLQVSNGRYGNMLEDTTTVSTLYRVTATGLVEIFKYESTRSGGEADDNDRCELAPFTPGKAMPTLVLDCVREIGHWHDENPGLDQTPRKETYRWNGTTYGAQKPKP